MTWWNDLTPLATPAQSGRVKQMMSGLHTPRVLTVTRPRIRW
ncbi:hypothetical protein [Amycolatopsis sp. NPDC059021]